MTTQIMEEPTFPNWDAFVHRLAAAIERDWGKCAYCGGFGQRTFNCDNRDCDAQPLSHWHNEPCEECVDEFGRFGFCPLCENRRYAGHVADCELKVGGPR